MMVIRVFLMVLGVHYHQFVLEGQEVLVRQAYREVHLFQDDRAVLGLLVHWKS